VPPVRTAPARLPFPDLRPALLRWGTGGECAAALLPLAEGHVRGLPEWEDRGGEEDWVREKVRVWLFHRLFDPHAAELTRRVRVRYPHLTFPDGVVGKAWLRARRWWMRDERQPVVNPMGWLMNATGYASLDQSSVMGGLFAPWPGHSDGAFDPSDPAAGQPDVNAEASEWLGRVARAMSELTVEERTLLTLRFGEGLDHAAVGQALGISDEAARKRVARLLSDLRKKLDPPRGETRP
jgi:RNA polymerase sigma factor (sigma-70 family)